MSRLSLSERIVIECGIYQKLSLGKIAKKIGKLRNAFQGKSEQIEQLHRESISLERIVTMQESAKPKDYAERMDAQGGV